MTKTIEELEVEIKELERTRDEAAKKIADIEKKKRDAEYALLLKSAESIRAVLTKEVIDAISPKHSRKSCNDTNLDGAYMDHGVACCTRCFLLKELTRNYVDEPFSLQIGVVGVRDY